MINFPQSLLPLPALPDTAHLTEPAQLPCHLLGLLWQSAASGGLTATTTATCCLTVLGTRSLPSRSLPGVLPLMSVGENSSLPLPGSRWGLALLGLQLHHFTLLWHPWPSLLMHVHVSLFAFLRRTLVLLDLTQCGLLLTNYICKDPISQ